MEQHIHCPRMFDGWRLRDNVVLHLRAGRVQGIANADAAAARASVATLQLPAGSLVAPGLIDIQVNGGGGQLFNDAPGVPAISAIAQAHRQQGTTALLPTLISDSRQQMLRAIAAVREAITSVPGVLGIHLEGPFLQPARRGIHRAQSIASFEVGRDGPSPDVQLLASLGDAGRTLVTLAPECVPPGTVSALRQRGVIVFAGHTEATFEQIQAALDEGLDGFTHLFNAMSQLAPRAPGVVGAALLARDSYAGLILDGHHVATGSVAVLQAARGLERVILVSDAMPAAGTALQEFRLQGQTIRVEGGRCVSAGGTLAGAAITLADAVRIGITQYGLHAEQALASATRIPAELLGLAGDYGALQAGARADLVVFDPGYRPVAVMLGGAWVRALELVT